MSQSNKAGFSSLQDRYLLPEGSVPLSGIQGIVRALLDSARADAAAGLNIPVFISGYQGSPLGGLDTELERSRAVTGPGNIVFRPGLNEELAATSVMGTQLLEGWRKEGVDGVTGVWYGKSPGVDRATDAMRHGNVIGTSPTGGAIALAGDDPAAKSSTVPGCSDATLAALGMPVFFPGNTAEMLTLFRHAVVMSRASGLWAGFKVVTKVADSTGVVRVAPQLQPVLPTIEVNGRPFRHRPSAELLGPNLMALEESMVGVRLELAREYIRLNNLNPVHGTPSATIGIVATGTTYFDLLTALAEMGLADSPGIRLMKVAALHPLDPSSMVSFAQGLREILVVEEKGPFVESAIKEILYGRAGAPLVTGKVDDKGVALVPKYGALEADDVTRSVGRRVLAHFEAPGAEKRIAELDAIAERKIEVLEQRTPFFCSGCPHNTSTRAGDDTVVGAGIGCHTLVLLNPSHRGKLTGVTQMGGEGAQFIGMAPFSSASHFVQNMGDGTFHHSGSLAIRASVAAGSNITYKILYNDAVAMTGGQRVEGRLAIPELIELLYLEGVSKVVVTADDPTRYRTIDLPRQIKVRPREELPEVERELARVPGTTVIIHDQLCAIEKRRRRRTGKLDTPKDIVVINERICEGCGDCGEKSNCLSVEPVMTEFGRKTRINQGSCSHDRSCLKGDCPSFLLVEPGKGKTKAHPLPSLALPDPEIRVPAQGTRIRMVGIGGTGVVTLAAILEVAATLDGLYTVGLDQTGLSQKAGPVVSDLHITADPRAEAVTHPAGTADLLLGFDLIGTASEKNLRVASPDRTRAVVSTSYVPNGREVADPWHQGPTPDAALNAVARFTSPQGSFRLPAQVLADTLYGDEIPANVMVLGAAWQLGLLPLSLESLTKAFELNNVAVKTNLEAFAWGRMAVVHPEAIESVLDPKAPAKEVSPRIAKLAEKLGLPAGTYREIALKRAGDLAAYQNAGLAKSYLERVEEFRKRAEKVFGADEELASAFARNLYKLIAYKDEYEVARLHLEWFAGEGSQAAKATMLLHPPVLRALGMKRKIKLNKSAKPAMTALHATRGLRGTRLDPFGRSDIRKRERALAAEYEAAMLDALAKAGADQTELLKRMAELPDLIRGYESVKERNLALYDQAWAEARTELGASRASLS